MNRAIPQGLAALLLILAPLARGQTFYFSDGRKASLPEARIVGETIKLPLTLDGGASGEVSLPISSITRLDWPAPAGLAAAEADLKAGRPADALKTLDALVPSQEVFRDITGSWWPKATSLRVEALARLGRDVDAEVALERLRRSRNGADLVDRSALTIVSTLVHTGKIAQARERLKAINLAKADAAILAQSDLINARLLQIDGKTEAALLSYLRVPVLYSQQRDAQPAALLGAASCYRALGMTARADAMINTLMERFPDSPEAAQAKR